jgi:carboxyl-terminal processing protease
MTKVLLRGLAAFVVLAGVLAGQARAADDSKSQAYIVIVGIDEYKDTQILPRKHAEADAKLIYDVFTSPAYGGVDTARVKLLLGKDDAKRNSQSATKDNIFKSLTWVVDNAKKEDMVVFVYIAEGAPVGDRTCYFTVDSDFKARDKTALFAGDVETVLDKLKSQHFCAFIDVNFKGFNAGDEKVGDPDLTKVYRELMGKDDEGAPPQSRTIFFANTGMKPSLDLKNHGIFTKVVAEGLKGAADTIGYEPDGYITVDELVKYVRKALPDLARAEGKTDEEKAQQPMILEAHLSDYVLVRNPAITEQTKKRIADFEAVAAKNNLPKQIVEQGVNYLDRMPKLKAQQTLRKLYQKLADSKATVDAFTKERDAILDSMKLSTKEANLYARDMLAANDVVIQYYYKKLTQGQLVDSELHSLYKYLDEVVPSTFKDRLEKAKAGELSREELETLLTDGRKQLGNREDLENTKDVTYSLHGMFAKLDRHSDYVDPELVQKFKDDLSGRFFGIGVQIRKNNTRDELQVITPLRGSPAYKAKMFAGDIITHVVREVGDDGKPLANPEKIATKGLTTEECVKKIKGPQGTKVKLIVEREGEAKPLEFNLIRGSVEMETVLGYKRNGDDSWDYVIDPENQICYIRLVQFQDSSAKDMEKVLKELNAQMQKMYKTGIRGFILDLRFNPGGLLDQAVRICDLFVDDGVIVTIKPRNGPETSYMAKGKGTWTSFPMVCLVNGYSASASEIVAGCLQDHGRALIVGSRSYGKGSVQTILPFEETGGRLKITTATFWRPNGKNLNKPSTSGKDEEDWGVKPNRNYDTPLSVKELNDLMDYQRDREIINRPGRPPVVTAPADFQDRQLSSALDYLRGEIKKTSKTAKKAG